MSLLIASAKAELAFIIDGGGDVITTGVKGHLRVPFGCIIDQVTLTADQDGSIRIDIWKSTYDGFPPVDADSITGGNEATITDSDKSQDAGLAGWNTALGEGDILAFNVDSVDGISRVTIDLHVRKR